MNLGTITDTLPWYKISLLREYNLIRIKSKLHRRRRRVYERSWDRRRSQKLFTSTIHWNLTNPVKNCHGIIGLLTSSHICSASYTKGKRRNVSRIIAVWIERKVKVRFHQMLMLSAKCARIPCRRKKKKNSVWKKDWNHSLIQLLRRRISGITPKLRKAKVRIQKVLQWIFIGYDLIATGIWKGDVLITDIEELEKLDASEIYVRRLNAKMFSFIVIMLNRGFNCMCRKKNHSRFHWSTLM